MAPDSLPMGGFKVAGVVGGLIASLAWPHARAPAQPPPDGQPPLASNGPTPPPFPPRYGDVGTSHLGLSLGLGNSAAGFAWGAGVAYGRFVLDGVAPTLEVDVSGGTELSTVASTMLSVRWLPYRETFIWPLIVPRAGRLFVSDHGDLWGAGGSVGVILGLQGRTGLQLAYEHLWLAPQGTCNTLSSGCSLQRWGVGLVVGL